MPEVEREYRFAAIATGGTGKGVRVRLKDAGVRDWRFDFAWPELMIAVEAEGGTYTNGRHTRGTGFEEDCIKYGEAMKLGWSVYRCTGGMIKSGVAINTIEILIKMTISHNK